MKSASHLKLESPKSRIFVLGSKYEHECQLSGVNQAIWLEMIKESRIINNIGVFSNQFSHLLSHISPLSD
jgi:hypothetical protein